MPTVRAIAQLLDEAQLSEIIIETTDSQTPQRLIVRREVVIVGETSLDETTGAIAESVTDETAPPAENNLVMVPSPTVGFFHHIEKPVGIGASVRAGQTIGIVKTMAIPNDVTASVDGRITEILAAEGVGVAFGQPLFIIEKETKES